MNSNYLSEDFLYYYKFIRVLGQGSFGQVVEAIDKSSQTSLAVKILYKNSLKSSEIKQLRQEAEILSSLSHENVIKFVHVNETQFKVYIGMELLSGKTLRDYLDKNEISEDSARTIFKQLLEGVSYLHSQGIVHRDLKPENIFISESPSLSIKILDFGLSEYLGQGRMATEHCGTLIYMAPEQIKGRYYGKSVDIWSCGILLYMLLAKGKHPFMQCHMKKADFMRKLEELAWEFPEEFPKKAKCLFENMIRFNPLERYTATRALQHPWLLNTDKKVPLSMFEEIKKYGDVIKLKNIVYQFLFMSLAKEKGLIATHDSKNVYNREICQEPSKRTIIRIRSKGSTKLERKESPLISERKIIRIQKIVNDKCNLSNRGRIRKLSAGVASRLNSLNSRNTKARNDQISIVPSWSKNVCTAAKRARMRVY